MTITASELWRMDRAAAIRAEHPAVSEAEAEERAQAESDAGLDPYRPEIPYDPDLPGLEPFERWLQWRG